MAMHTFSKKVHLLEIINCLLDGALNSNSFRKIILVRDIIRVVPSVG